MKKILIFAAIILSACALRAQQLTIAYETHTLSANEEEVSVYLVNNKAADLKIQSFALELAHNNATFLNVRKDAFKRVWSDKMAKVEDVQKASSIGSGYSDMFQYGNVDPTIAGELTVTIPGNSKVLALRVAFQTQGQAQFQVLNQQQGQANAVFAEDGTQIDYNVHGTTNNPVGNPFVVDFLNVEAFPLQNRVAEIRWTVANEDNVFKYVVEKSMDGELFTDVAKELEVNNTEGEHSYVTTDKSEMFPINYYRIKEVDINGGATFSDVVEVRFSQGEGRKMVLYPNPVVDGNLTIQHDDLLASLERVIITDQLGRVVYERNLTDSDRSQNLKMDVSLLSAGLYSVQGVGEDGRTGVSRFTVK
ncbi:MAG: T9SS type A sorting domain-containing protein [Bacteroidia bacterium]